jgi:hypothetical protein
MKTKFRDFKVRTEVTNRGEIHSIYVAKNILVSSYLEENIAQEICSKLNEDPWYFEKMFWHEYKEARKSYVPNIV